MEKLHVNADPSSVREISGTDSEQKKNVKVRKRLKKGGHSHEAEQREFNL